MSIPSNTKHLLPDYFVFKDGFKSYYITPKQSAESAVYQIFYADTEKKILLFRIEISHMRILNGEVQPGSGFHFIIRVVKLEDQDKLVNAVVTKFNTMHPDVKLYKAENFRDYMERSIQECIGPMRTLLIGLLEENRSLSTVLTKFKNTDSKYVYSIVLEGGKLIVPGIIEDETTFLNFFKKHTGQTTESSIAAAHSSRGTKRAATQQQKRTKSSSTQQQKRTKSSTAAEQSSTEHHTAAERQQYGKQKKTGGRKRKSQYKKRKTNKKQTKRLYWGNLK
jgi:hypothetical protein